MAANIQELILGFGKGKQADIATANAVGAIWRPNKLNAEILNPKFITEDDAAELGKGHEFPTTTYRSYVDIQHRIEKYLSAEIMAWAAAFGLGSVVKSGTGPYTYTCTPLDKVTNGEELPYFSYLEQIRPGAGVIWDKMFVGCALESFLVQVATAPGRASSKIVMEFLGSGKTTDPSGITLPAKLAEKELPGASLALTVMGVDYVASKDIVSLEWGWKNNINANTGFYPGSGTQDGYALRGRLEVGARAPSLKFVVRVNAGSAEYAHLKALDTGTAVITQTYDSNNTYTATFQQIAFRSVDVAESDGKVTVAVEASPQYHSSNGVLSIVSKCEVDGICQAPA